MRNGSCFAHKFHVLIMSRGCHLQLVRHLRSACERAGEKLSFLWQGLASGRVEVSMISDQWQLAILLIFNYIYIPFVYQELYYMQYHCQIVIFASKKVI